MRDNLKAFESYTTQREKMSGRKRQRYNYGNTSTTKNFFLFLHYFLCCVDTYDPAYSTQVAIFSHPNIGDPKLQTRKKKGEEAGSRVVLHSARDSGS